MISNSRVGQLIAAVLLCLSFPNQAVAQRMSAAVSAVLSDLRLGDITANGVYQQIASRSSGVAQMSALLAVTVGARRASIDSVLSDIRPDNIAASTGDDSPD